MSPDDIRQLIAYHAGRPPNELTVRDLEGRFLRYAARDGQEYYEEVDTLAEAQGISFLCPKCYLKNGGPEGTHSVICWSRSRGTPDGVSPGPGRWALEGTGLDDLTLGADPPSTARSVQLLGACGWHGFVIDGVVA